MWLSPSSRRSLLLLATVVLGCFVGSWAVLRAVVADARLADLHTEQDLPADVQAEVDATWGRFIDVFGPRRRCFDDVSLLLVNDLDQGDARYVVNDARIEIRIPTSPRRFRESLVHELAHHVEHTCGAFDDLRGGGPTEDWYGTDLAWRERPAELWAETVVFVVNGERVRHERTMPLPDGAPDLVLAWASGQERWRHEVGTRPQPTSLRHYGE